MAAVIRGCWLYAALQQELQALNMPTLGREVSRGAAVHISLAKHRCSVLLKDLL